MATHPPTVSVTRFESVIDDLPDEVLEYILSLVPPYIDLQQCSLVCKRWQKSVKNVIRHTQKNLLRAISDFNIMWKDITPVEMSCPTITKRYSHSACRHGNSMYVFGGCTSTSTTFNDLWRLDLNERQWERPLTMGTYPSPKACASFVCYKEALVLFGGWTHPSPYPLHQAWRLFNELHMYSIVSKRWTCINTTTPPPAMAGHSCTIHGENMVVFGGLHKTNYMGQYGSSNDIWIFNLENHTWNKQITTDIKPHPRYGQSQIALDDSHILILGGCGGPNMLFNDVWLLSMSDPVWMWQEVRVHNIQWAPSHMWCHPACKIGQHVVVFSRNPVSNAPALAYSAQWNTPSQLRGHNAFPPARDDDSPLDLAPRRSLENTLESRPVDRDINVNGRRGTFGHRSSSSSMNLPSTSSSSGDESESESFGQYSPLAKKVVPSSNKSSDIAGGSSFETPNGRQPSSKSYMNAPYNEVDPCDPAPSGPLGMAAFRDVSTVLRTSNTRNRQRQLESLKRMEERLKTLSRNTGGSSSNSGGNPRPETSSTGSSSNSSSSSSSPQFFIPPKKSIPKNAMAMFVLNISNVLSTECSVEWLPMKGDCSAGGPEEMILYTLLPGKGELIMFGGIQKDATSITAQAQLSNVTNTVSNSLYFISAPKGII